MPITDLLETRLQRLVPHEGLVIDVETWSAAHSYHALQQRLHAMAMHSPGIVTGLEVVAWDPPDNSVVINPGLAVDADGRTIIVSEHQRFQIQTTEAGTIYLVLQFREVAPGATGTPSARGSQSPYVLEAYSLEVRRELPREAYVELARIQVSGTSAPVTDAQDINNPGPNEIDVRHRMVSGERPLATVNIGVIPLEMTPEGQIRHAQGVLSLVRAINATTRYRADFKGSINLSHPIADCELVILAGQEEFTLADEWVVVLRNFMERGGVLMVEVCGSGVGRSNGAPFRQSFLQLAERLVREMTNVGRGHALFKSHHLFSEVPDGVDGQPLLVAGDGIVYSDADYGCLWDGGRNGASAKRELIRSATELGINISVYSSERTRLRSARLAAR